MTEYSTGSASAHPELPQNTPFPNDQPADPRTCGSCALWVRYPDDAPLEIAVGKLLSFGECGCTEARATCELVRVREDFGCRFHVPRDPAACRATLVAACARALYVQRYGRFSGRNTMPKSFDELLPYTREILEIETIRVLQAAGVLP